MYLTFELDQLNSNVLHRGEGAFGERERIGICYLCVGLLLTDTMLVTTNNVPIVSLIQLVHPSSVSLCYTILVHVHMYMYVRMCICLFT